MGLARLHQPGAVLVASLLLVLTAATRVHSACNATCQRDLARCMATQCHEIGRETCRRRCKPVAIRTLAYVVSECREDAAGMDVGSQALRIRRGDQEPITVVGFGPSEPQPDRLQACRMYGDSRLGAVAVVVGGLERLGVSPDGSGVVFEVTSDTAVIHLGPTLPSDQEGIFFVRADGSGLRRLGPASRDPSFRIGPDPFGRYIFYVNRPASIPFSPNGRRIVFTDLGPGPGGEEAVQIVVLDLRTGQRTQVTHLPSAMGPDPDPGNVTTGYPRFIDNDTVAFVSYVDPEGLNPQHNLTVFTVRIDGSRLKAAPTPVAAQGSRVIPIFGVATPGSNVFILNVPGTPLNGFPSPALRAISEVFVQQGKNLIQLTNFHRVDTSNPFSSVTPGRAFFTASADPLGTNDPLGGNPSGNCQIFSIETSGGGLRQITHFNPGSPASNVVAACWMNGPPECPVGWQLTVQDPVTKAVLFDSACDPFHTNVYGGQLFAMRPDGSGLRQLTDAAGFTSNSDGSIRVELADPFAYSAPLR